MFAFGKTARPPQMDGHPFLCTLSKNCSINGCEKVYASHRLPTTSLPGSSVANEMNFFFSPTVLVFVVERNGTCEPLRGRLTSRKRPGGQRA